MDPAVSIASVLPVAGQDVHYQLQRRAQPGAAHSVGPIQAHVHIQQPASMAASGATTQTLQVWPSTVSDAVTWNGPVFQGMAPPAAVTSTAAGNTVMHFTNVGYPASFVPAVSFATGGIKTEPGTIVLAMPSKHSNDPRIEYVRSVSQLSSDSEQDDHQQHHHHHLASSAQLKNGAGRRGKGKKAKKAEELAKAAAAVGGIAAAGVGSSAGAGRKTKDRVIPEKRFKCPECSLMFPHVSALYNHASLRHYRQQLSEKYRKKFSENSQRCHLCGLPQTWSTFLQHIGSRHRRIHYFMTPDIHRAYMDLPTKRSHTKLVERIDCLVCGGKDFSSLTQYKQHLTTHFWKKMTDKFGNCNGKVCPQCHKHFGHSSGVLMHLGAKHNFILEFSPQDVVQQLHSLGVN